MQIIGVDFSGARDAGRKIWLCRAQIRGKRLQINQLLRAAQLPQSSAERETALSALCKYLQQQNSAAVGLDFPFGVAQTMMNGQSWRDWSLTLGKFADADAFRTQLMSENGGHEARRLTDIETKTPLSPVNWRLHRQTFYGIRDVLVPMLQNGAQINPLAMETSQNSGPILIEICPASTLKRENLYRSYKGRGAILQAARREILAQITARFGLRYSAEIGELAEQNSGGDALDAILASVATARYIREEGERESSEIERIEGRVWS